MSNLDTNFLSSGVLMLINLSTNPRTRRRDLTDRVGRKLKRVVSFMIDLTINIMNSSKQFLCIEVKQTNQGDIRSAQKTCMIVE